MEFESTLDTALEFDQASAQRSRLASSVTDIDMEDLTEALKIGMQNQVKAKKNIQLKKFEMISSSQESNDKEIKK